MNINSRMNVIKYFDTFTGIGGFTLAINQVYEELCIKNKKPEQKRVGGENRQCGELDNFCTDGLACVGFSEIDKYAIQIYKKHFPTHKNYGDITKLAERDVPDHDLFVGGFPCQSFSIAGKRRGFEDTRGTLFFEIARILRAKRPKNFILENVKGLLSHDEGNTFKVVIRTLDGLGYFVEWQVLNSKNFGVPQNRERVFIVGHFGKEPGRKVFPIRENSEADIVLPTLTSRYWGGQANGGYLRQISPSGGSQGERVYDPDGIATTIASQAGGLGAKTGLYQISPCIRAEHHNTADVHFIPEEGRIRRLTPLECERLQGFPDGWTEGVSDTQRYKCLGNAVTVNVVREIAGRLLINQK